MYLNGRITEGIAITKIFALQAAKSTTRFLRFSKFLKKTGAWAVLKPHVSGSAARIATRLRSHGSGGMLSFNLEDLNRLEFLDAKDPSPEQGARNLLVTDMKHPIFPNFWRPGPHHRLRITHLHSAALARIRPVPSNRPGFPPEFRRRATRAGSPRHTAALRKNPPMDASQLFSGVGTWLQMTRPGVCRL